MISASNQVTNISQLPAVCQIPRNVKDVWDMIFVPEITFS